METVATVKELSDISDYCLEQDDELIATLKKTKENVHVEKYMCRLPVSKILHICKSDRGEQNVDVLDFIKRWCIAARGLFSDDVLTLRLVDHLRTYYGNKGAQVQLLAEMLLDKMPTLGAYVCK